MPISAKAEQVVSYLVINRVFLLFVGDIYGKIYVKFFQQAAECRCMTTDSLGSVGEAKDILLFSCTSGLIECNGREICLQILGKPCPLGLPHQHYGANTTLTGWLEGLHQDSTWQELWGLRERATQMHLYRCVSSPPNPCIHGFQLYAVHPPPPLFR